MAEDKEVKRLNYFKGQFLQEEDFNAEQAYHIRMRRLHNRALHTWGVVEGLAVSQGSSTNSVVVAPGIAIDNLGQEIVLPIPGSSSIAITGVTKGDVFITVSYGEVDDPLDKYATAGVEGKFKKKTERPLFRADAAAPAAGSVAVLLAKVSVDGGNVTAISNEVRRLASSALFSSMDLEVRSLKWGNNSRLQTDQGGSIELGGDPNTAGVGTPYIDFHFGPKAAEDFNVRLINDANGTLSIQGKVLQITGSAGIGTPTPGARLTIQQGTTNGVSAANGKVLFASAVMGTGAASDGGIEFRHDNLTQGIGFGYNTIYATGSNANQDLAIQSRGTGSVLLNPTSGNVGIGSASAARAKLQVTGGAIMPAIGNNEQAGIQFPPDPGVGTGDRAFIRYYVESGTETTKLMIGVANDPDDAIGFTQFGAERMTISNGNVGIGIVSPTEKLHIEAGSIFVNGESAGVIVDAGGAKRVGLLKYAGKEGGVWRLNAQDFEIGRLNPEVTALPGAPTAFTTDLYIGATGNVGIGTGAAAPAARLQVAGGAIMPAIGNSEQAGIQFPPDPGVGAGDRAFIRYYVESGTETTKLMIGVANDADDAIGFTQFNAERMTISGGNVGIGVTAPGRKLVVDGNSTILAGGGNWGEGLRIIAKGSDTFGATFYGRADEDAKALWFTGIGSFADNNRESDLIFLSGPGRGSPDTPAFTSSSLGGIYRGDAVMVLEHSTGNALFGANVGIGTTTPNAKLDVAGDIRSPMWRVTQLFTSRSGVPSPISATFTSGGGTLMVFVSGSGFRATAGLMGMVITVDPARAGGPAGRAVAERFTNEPNSHKTFVANAQVILSVPAGSHTLVIEPLNDGTHSTVFDFNDRFTVTVLELPFNQARFDAVINVGGVNVNPTVIA